MVVQNIKESYREGFMNKEFMQRKGQEVEYKFPQPP